MLIAALGMMLASIAGAANVAAQDDDTPTISIGAVAYTEQNIVGEILALILEDAGYEVERTFNLAVKRCFTKLIWAVRST